MNLSTEDRGGFFRVGMTLYHGFFRGTGTGQGGSVVEGFSEKTETSGTMNYYELLIISLVRLARAEGRVFGTAGTPS